MGKLCGCLIAHVFLPKIMSFKKEAKRIKIKNQRMNVDSDEGETTSILHQPDCKHMYYTKKEIFRVLWAFNI